MKLLVSLLLSMYACMLLPVPAAYSQEIGDAVLMGEYPYSKNGRKKPIEWIIIDKDQDGTFLLLNSYGIDAKQYNAEAKAVTWKTCTLRKWLNGSFYETAFNDKEKKSIKTSYIKNYTGDDTKDKIFLLSIPEAKKYLSPGFNNSKKLRKYIYTVAKLTPYAFKRGGNRYRYEHSGVPLVSWWWLRSPGDSAEKAAFTGRDGDVYSDGFLVQLDYGAVRAALRADLHNYVNISNNEKRGLWIFAGGSGKIKSVSAFTLEISSAAAAPAEMQ